MDGTSLPHTYSIVYEMLACDAMAGEQQRGQHVILWFSRVDNNLPFPRVSK